MPVFRTLEGHKGEVSFESLILPTYEHHSFFVEGDVLVTPPISSCKSRIVRAFKNLGRAQRAKDRRRVSKWTNVLRRKGLYFPTKREWMRYYRIQT